MINLIVFLSLLSPLFAKPVIDLRDSNMSKNHRKKYERPDFIWKTKGKNSDVVVLTDAHIKKADKMRKKGYKKVIAYLMEPRVIDQKIYDYVMKNPKKYDLIFTFDQTLLTTNPKRCRLVHAVGSSTLHHHAIHPKSKMCSIITGKSWTEGHRIRHDALARYAPFFDGVKTDATPRVPWKDDWLNDFCFSVAAENSKIDYYFTEKIIDCFRSGTVPIYWGCPSIGKYFDLDGIIIFNDLDELGDILANLSYDEYEKRLPAIQRNFELANHYPQCTLVDRPEMPDAMDGIWPHIKSYFGM